MKQLKLILIALMAWPLVIQAAEPSAYKLAGGKLKRAQSVQKYSGNSKSIRRAPSDKMGVVATLKYEKLPDMQVPRLMHQTFSVGNDLIAVGGHTTGFTPTKSAEVFHRGVWQSLDISSTHDGAFSVILNDGRIMVGGGFSKKEGVGQSKTVDIYNPQSGRFNVGPGLSVARALSKAICVGGKVFVSGNWYGEDNVMDYYNGSSFTSVGDMDARSYPYLFPDENGNIISFSAYDTEGKQRPLYTYEDGSRGWVADYYDVKAGTTQYVSTPYSEDVIPTTLPHDIRPSDYHFTSGGENYYLVLARMRVSGNNYRHVLLFYCVEDGITYIFGDFDIPSRHPVTNEEISYRGGVFANEEKNEIYILGASGKGNNQTLHIISLNYMTDEWTIASAPGFSYDLMQGSWTLMADGSLACTGGSIDGNYQPSKEAYLFTPPTAGEGDGYNPDPGPGPGPGDQTLGQTLVVLTKNGAKTQFVLKDKPKVKIEGKNLRITSTRADVTFALSDVVNFTYVNTDPTGIDDLDKEASNPAEVSYKDGTLVLSQLKQGASVAVYTADGKIVRELKAQHQGSFRLSLASLPKGVYIVKADTITYKIMKR